MGLKALSKAGLQVTAAVTRRGPIVSMLEVGELRWPTKGDRLLRKSHGGANQTRFEAHSETRHYCIWDGNMRAAELLVASCENDRYESVTLVYPILYNYRHAIELALKWIIMKFGDYVSVEVGDYEHHNLWKLWCVYKAIVLELGSDDGNTLAVVEQVIKDFHDLDKSGQAFRYADAKNGTFKLPDYPIDLRNTQEVMKGVGNFFAGVYGQLDNNVSAAGLNDYVDW